ncbi:MAG: hypothetical protein K9J13_04130 [Saprospiraceae bacterium]|nr:hypothetical protein [Saprospiraceae bacterium]
MAGYKETPRQKMIGMMYLVLTALLALNVSKEILDAFVIVNEGLETTNEILYAKNGELYTEFGIQFDQNPEKVGIFYEKAKLAKQYSDDLIAEIKDIKREIIAYTEFGDKKLKVGEYEEKDKNNVKKTVKDVPLEDFPLEHIAAKDNYDKPWLILGGLGESGTNGRAADLKKMINEYKANMLNLLDEKQKQSTVLGFDTEDKWDKKLAKNTPWEYNNFYHTVLYADVVLLNKYIAEVLNTQAEITTALLGNITKKDFKFDKITAKTIPASSYVISGEEYKADIFVAAYSSTEKPEVYVKMDADTFTSADIIDENKIDSVSGGMGKYSYRAAGIGEKKYAGIIRIKKPNTNEYDEHFFRNIFTVASPTAVVAPMSMNVLYIGVENPIAISVPGIPQGSISPSATGGAPLRADKGNYTIKPNGSVREIVINVGYTNSSGERKSAGTQMFRVKRVPDPVAVIAGKTQGTISRQQLLNAGGILASMKDFDFDLRFKVIKFEMMVTVGGRADSKKVSGNKFSKEMSDLIKRLGKGTPITFQYITVKGEDGTTRTVNPIAFTLN